MSKIQKRKGEFKEELKIQINKVLAQRERLERLPMKLLYTSMKMRLKQCKIVKNILTYYIGAIK